jgi:hypothetical protein
MKKIKLTQGMFALVDDEDFDYLNQWKWYANKGHSTFYAQRQVSININKQRQTAEIMHRLIMNAPAYAIIDHINHNGLDNQKNNLRICNKSENQRNSLCSRGGTSKYKGVFFHKQFSLRGWKAWEAGIRYNKKRLCLGSFYTEIEAALAYNKKAKELFGEFAYLNKIKVL